MTDPTKSDDALGVNTPITRKDFLNASLLGVGAALLHAPSPLAAMAGMAGHNGADAQRADSWTGPGGTGDYASSNGNTKAVLDAAHKIRDGVYARQGAPTDTGELYDLVVVGGGITGLTAAHFFAKSTNGGKRCLVLENHPIFGGEAKENEFVVNGMRLLAPQGSNDFGVPRAGSGWQSDLWDEIKMPREFEWSAADVSTNALRVARDNYQPMEGVGEYGVDIGYFFDQRSTIAPTKSPVWLKNIWQNDLADLPVSDAVRQDLLKWRSTAPDTKGLAAEPFARYLDTMTYRDYLEKVAGYGPHVTKMIEPVIGLISGASPDGVSARAAQQIGMPGVSRPRGRKAGLGLSFPGGNVTYARHLLKGLIPEGISGEFTFAGVHNGKVNWAALDRPNQTTRVRVGATVSSVQHDGPIDSADFVNVTYAKADRMYRVRARRVAMATGGWVNKQVVLGMPQDMLEACTKFVYAPALIVNVALTNWKFMHKLGITAARWFDDKGLGFVANIRQQMQVGTYRAPNDPASPTVLTLYMGLYAPGYTAAEQGSMGRKALLEKPYADYERTIRTQLTHQFASAGFDAKRDIAGIILNRWGHARLVQPPGWYYGVGSAPSPREIVAKGFGRIAIGHSELNGHQSATGAMTQGKRIGEASAV